MRYNSTILAGLAATLLAGTAPVFAQGNPSPAPADSTVADSAPVAADNGAFLAKVHTINQAEIKAGQLAAKNGATKSARDYGKLLEKHHATADKELTALASKESINLTAKAAEPDVKALKDKLDSVYAVLAATGKTEFDKVFAGEMVSGHKEAIELVTAQEKTLADVPTKTFAAKILPQLREHLSMAESLQKSSAAH